MFVITREFLHKFLGPCVNHAPEAPAGLRDLANCFNQIPPVSVKNLIRLAELPDPKIKFFEANPMDVEPNSKSTLRWAVENCENACSIEIRKRVINSGQSSKVSDGLKNPGSLEVTVPSNTEYTITATFPGKAYRIK